MMQSFLTLLCGAVSCSALAAQGRETIVHETSSMPQGWRLLGDADESAYLQLSIALSQPRLGELKRRVAEISDINSADFGAHLTQIQLQKYQAPGDESTSAVFRWLDQAGIEEMYADGAWIRFNATVRSVNILLDCKLDEYETPTHGRVYRTTEYSLPAELASHVQFVFPTTQFIDSSPSEPLQDEENFNIAPRQASGKQRPLSS
jgi:tripeptidyl-peptidase I